jgi:TolB protein
VAFQLQANPTAPANIWTIRDNGTGLRRLTNTPAKDEAYPAWSPDGRWIAFIRSNADYSEGQLWVMDRHGRHQRQLTFDPAPKDQLPDWRPDGKQIAYEAGGGDGGDLWLINPDGSGQVNVTHTPEVPELGVAWSPDGQRLAYLNFRDRLVYTMRPDGSDVRVVRPGLGTQYVPAWQPLARHHH